MPTWFLALAPVTAFVVAIGAAHTWETLREPHRDPRRPCVVVDRRTYRQAQRRVDRLLAAGDFPRAWTAALAISQWLRHERHYGSARRQAQLTEDLATWTSRAAELNPLCDPDLMP